MNIPFLKIVFKIALACSLAMLVYEMANRMLIYRYIKYDYYLAAVAVIALIAGVLVARKKSTPALSLVPELTNKELHILQLIAEGKSNKEIAALNFVELSTIKTHINNLYTKLDVSNRKQAVNIYQKLFAEAKSTFSPPSVI